MVRKRKSIIRRKKKKIDGGNGSNPSPHVSFYDQLNFRQKKFVKLLLIDPDHPGWAADKAGYRCGAASANSLLKNPRIQAAIEEEKKRLVDRIDVKQEKVIEELAKVGFFSLEEVIEFDGESVKIKPFDELGRDTIAAIREIRVSRAPDGLSDIISLKTYNKLEALQYLGRYFGIFNDKLDLNVGVKIKDVISALPPELGERIRRALVERFSGKGTSRLPDKRKVINLPQ